MAMVVAVTGLQTQRQRQPQRQRPQPQPQPQPQLRRQLRDHLSDAFKPVKAVLRRANLVLKE